MSTANKLAYLGVTKSKIKDVINMTDANIDANTTFRNYAQALYNGYINVLKNRNTLLDNMNIGTSTGAISDSANLPVYEDKMSKLSTQTTTTQSANLFDEDYYNNTDLYSTSGVYKYTLTRIKGNRNLVIQCRLKEGKTAISGLYVCLGTTPNPNTSDSIYKWFINNGSTNQTGVQYFTGYDDLYLSFYPSTTPVADIFNNYNLWVSTSNIQYEPFVPNSPSPDYPSEVKTVKGYRNYYDSSKLNHFAFATFSGSTVLLSSNNYIGYAIPCNEGEVYSISRLATTNSRFRVMFTSEVPNEDVALFGGTGNISAYDNALKIENIVVPSGAKYMNIYLSNANETIPPIMINKGTTTLPYVPYGTNYINLNITDGVNTVNKQIPLNDNEICEIGDYKDDLIIDKNGHCWLNKKIEKVVFDGSSDESYSVETINDLFRATATYFNNLDIVNLHTPYMCSRLTYLGLGLQTQEGIANSDIVSANRCFIYINPSRLTESTLTAFRTWLSNNNLEIYFQLATPTLIDLNYNVDLTLYEGANTITNSEDMDMEIKYIKNVYE